MSGPHPTSWTEWAQHVLTTIKRLVAKTDDHADRLSRLEAQMQATQQHIHAVDSRGPRGMESGIYEAIRKGDATSWKDLFRPPQIYVVIALLAILLMAAMVIASLSDKNASQLNPFNDAPPSPSPETSP